MKVVNRDVTIPLLILSIVVLSINELGMNFDVKLLVGFSVLMGAFLYWLYASEMMAIISALLSGNFLFVCFKYEIITTLIGLMSFGIVIAGACALIYNLISGDDVSKKGSRLGLYQPMSFMAFGILLYLTNGLFFIFSV